MLKAGRYIHSVSLPSGETLFHNLMTHRTIRADESAASIVAEIIRNPNSAAPSPHWSEMREELEQAKFLIPIEFDEREAVARMFSFAKTSQTHASLAVVTTRQCNLRCVYCYQRHENDFMSLVDADRALALVRNQIGDGGIAHYQITWWGGEPLANLPVIEHLAPRLKDVLEAASVAYSSYISTNAVLLTRRVARTLGLLNLETVQITVDGPEAFHDKQRPACGGRSTYRAVLGGIAALHEELPLTRVRLRVNLTHDLLTDDIDWSSFFYDLTPWKDVITLQFQPTMAAESYSNGVSPVKRQFLDRKDSLERKANELGFDSAGVGAKRALPLPGQPYCGAIFDNNWILLPGSRLAKCTTDFHDPKQDCGVIDADGHIQAFERSKFWLTYSPLDHPVCRDCDVLPSCMGGCQILPDPAVSSERCYRKAAIKDLIHRRILDGAKGDTHGKQDDASASS